MSDPGVSGGSGAGTLRYVAETPDAPKLVPGGALIPAHEGMVAARLNDHSWSDIYKYIADGQQRALSYGHTQGDVDSYLGYPDPKPMDDALRQSWTTRLAQEEDPKALDLKRDDPALRGEYADAISAGAVKTPMEFAARYVDHYTNQVPDADAAKAQEAVPEIAKGLPSINDVLDYATSLTHAADKPITPENIQTTKENILDHWSATGDSFDQMYKAAIADPDRLDQFTTPQGPLDASASPGVVGHALANAVEAFKAGNAIVWGSPPSEITQALQSLHNTFKNNLVLGPATSIPAVGAGVAEGGMRAVNGVLAGIIAGGSQLIDEASGHQYPNVEKPSESGEVGVGILNDLTTMLAFVSLSGGKNGLRGTPTVMQDAEGKLVPLASAPADYAKNAVKMITDRAQDILDAPVTVVDPLKPAGENVTTATAEQAYAPSPLQEAAHAVAGLAPEERTGLANGEYAQKIAAQMAKDITFGEGKVRNPIVTYHGTPHDFDQFDSSKVGAGEGAQAYGHGLYFAENPKVAATYKRKLSEREFMKLVQETYSEEDNPQDAEASLMESSELSTPQKNLLKALKDDGWLGFDYPHQAVQAALHEPHHFVLSAETQSALKQFGNLYKVNLHLDKERLLDWDKPMSQQTEFVKKALGFTSESDKTDGGVFEGQSVTFAPMTAGEWIKDMYDKLGPDATEHFKELGIQGVRYFDHNSRKVNEGSHNYVVFHDKAIEMLEKNGEKIDQADVQKQIETQVVGNEAANAVWAHFHNLMLDQAGGVSPATWFRMNPDKLLAKAQYATGRDISQALIRSARGQADRIIAAQGAKLDEYRKTVNKLLPEYEKQIRLGPMGNLAGNPIHEMLKYIEGRSAGATMDPKSELFPVANAIRDVYQTMRSFIEQSLPDMKNFYDDYYRHLWTDPRKADRVFGVGPQGSGSSLNLRTIPTLAEGIEKGLMPKFLNPIDNTTHYVAGMAYHLAARDVLSRAENAGHVVYGASNPNIGWEQLNGAGATKAVPMTRADGTTTAMIQNAYGSPGFARSYNYWVGKGFYGMPGGSPWYTRMQYFANAMTGFLLALPGYHTTAIAQETAVNGIANGIGAISRGQMARGLYGIGMSTPVLPEVVRQTLRGSDLYKSYLDLNSNDEAMNLFVNAGGRMGPRQDVYRMGDAQSVFKSIAEGSLRIELKQDLRHVLGTDEEAPGTRAALVGPRLVGLVGKEVGRVLNTISAPLFDHMIPNIKAGVTFDALQSWIDANPTAGREAKLAMARRIVNSVDDRFGEMNQDNLFWPKAVKQALNLLTVSVGWEFGSLRAAGIAGNNTDTRFTMDRLRWLVSLPIVNGIMGSIYQYLKTGTTPWETTTPLLDTQFPRTGGHTLQYGQYVPERVAIPGYPDKDFSQWYKLGLNAPDWIKMAQDTAKGIMQKGNPAVQTLSDFLFGEDEIGHKVSHLPMQALHYPFNQPDIYNLKRNMPTGTQWMIPKEFPQYMSDLWGHMMPIFLQAASRTERGSHITGVDRMLGVREAPGFVDNPAGYAQSQQRQNNYLDKQELYRFRRENSRLAEPAQ